MKRKCKNCGHPFSDITEKHELCISCETFKSMVEALLVTTSETASNGNKDSRKFWREKLKTILTSTE